MTVNNRALALADELEDSPDEVTHINAASTIRFLVTFNQQLMDEVARLNKAVADEREACAALCDEVDKESQSQWPKRLATMIRARGNT